MKAAIELVQRFQGAVATGDLATARACLADTMTFRGPFDQFDRPEPYLQALGRLSQIVERVDVQRVFADDAGDVCVLYDLVTRAPVATTSFVAEWFQVRAGKIASVRVVFDPRPFEPMFKR
jgi:ketosteroid isomerase-like protein